ncbi:hypothetical protein MLD38_024094 [Melastoma candidum]|uniref:Uncharacterized protein n=1 Tax=Melastoma candidum TaxID=119954 RepID=A0ACB9NSJ9_9MYRT|nr:hypothetical protein MLD38_024094 [Melastoma candidum]
MRPSLTNSGRGLACFLEAAFDAVIGVSGGKGGSIDLDRYVPPSHDPQAAWEIAALAILTAVSQYSIAFISSAFAGHIGDLELSAVSVSENVLEGFVYGVMLGMGSALETLCGQAFGGSKSHMLGIYM